MRKRYRLKFPSLVQHDMTGALNLMWHFTAFLLSTVNMSLTHPWKFVVVPWVRRNVLGIELARFFASDNDRWAQRRKASKEHAPHELAFFRVSGRVHRTGFFDGWRGLVGVACFLAAVAFVSTPFVRFEWPKAVAFSLGPYVVTSAFFFTVTQISHVQEATQRDGSLDDDFFRVQARTSLDYAVNSELWRFLTGGLNVQSIHHVMPGVCSCHYTKLYPKFYALCSKHGCAPANAVGILEASYLHLKHVYDLGELYRGPSYDGD